MDDTKEIERKLQELSTSFILLFDKLRYKDIISQEEYDTHTKVKKEFLKKIDDN
ncbi:hypothetical protein [Proteiniborus sp.]|uniref:hypothetical protein n=1 Tax=Proteiniborus sp. TaxID=2079015 RepID=UPI003327F03D